MSNAVAEGVNDIDGVEAVVKSADQAGVNDLLSCDGIAIGSPEYFGYMSGIVKDFFDRTYEPLQGKSEIFKKPYIVFISAGNDGTGALLSIERIVSGYPLKQVHEPIVAKGKITNDALDACKEMGKTIAAGCQLRIF